MARRRQKPQPKPTTARSIAALSRRDCKKCGPESLHDGLTCVNCGNTAAVPRSKDDFGWAARAASAKGGRTRVVLVADAVIEAAFDRE